MCAQHLLIDLLCPPLPPPYRPLEESYNNHHFNTHHTRISPIYTALPLKGLNIRAKMTLIFMMMIILSLLTHQFTVAFSFFKFPSVSSNFTANTTSIDTTHNISLSQYPLPRLTINNFAPPIELQHKSPNEFSFFWAGNTQLQSEEFKLPHQIFYIDLSFLNTPNNHRLIQFINNNPHISASDIITCTKSTQNLGDLPTKPSSFGGLFDSTSSRPPSNLSKQTPWTPIHKVLNNAKSVLSLAFIHPYQRVDTTTLPQYSSTRLHHYQTQLISPSFSAHCVFTTSVLNNYNRFDPITATTSILPMYAPTHKQSSPVLPPVHTGGYDYLLFLATPRTSNYFYITTSETHLNNVQVYSKQQCLFPYPHLVNSSHSGTRFINSVTMPMGTIMNPYSQEVTHHPTALVAQFQKSVDYFAAQYKLISSATDISNSDSSPFDMLLQSIIPTVPNLTHSPNTTSFTTNSQFGTVNDSSFQHYYTQQQLSQSPKLRFDLNTLSSREFELKFLYRDILHPRHKKRIYRLDIHSSDFMEYNINQTISKDANNNGNNHLSSNIQNNTNNNSDNNLLFDISIITPYPHVEVEIVPMHNVDNDKTSFMISFVDIFRNRAQLTGTNSSNSSFFARVTNLNNTDNKLYDYNTCYDHNNLDNIQCNELYTSINILFMFKQVVNNNNIAPLDIKSGYTVHFYEYLSHYIPQQSQALTFSSFAANNFTYTPANTKSNYDTATQLLYGNLNLTVNKTITPTLYGLSVPASKNKTSASSKISNFDPSSVSILTEHLHTLIPYYVIQSFPHNTVPQLPHFNSQLYQYPLTHAHYAEIKMHITLAQHIFTQIQSSQQSEFDPTKLSGSDPITMALNKHTTFFNKLTSRREFDSFAQRGECDVAQYETQHQQYATQLALAISNHYPPPIPPPQRIPLHTQARFYKVQFLHSIALHSSASNQPIPLGPHGTTNLLALAAHNPNSALTHYGTLAHSNYGMGSHNPHLLSPPLPPPPSTSSLPQNSMVIQSHANLPSITPSSTQLSVQIESLGSTRNPIIVQFAPPTSREETETIVRKAIAEVQLCQKGDLQNCSNLDTLSTPQTQQVTLTSQFPQLAGKKPNTTMVGSAAMLAKLEQQVHHPPQPIKPVGLFDYISSFIVPQQAHPSIPQNLSFDQELNLMLSNINKSLVNSPSITSFSSSSVSSGKNIPPILTQIEFSQNVDPTSDIFTPEQIQQLIHSYTASISNNPNTAIFDQILNDYAHNTNLLYAAPNQHKQYYHQRIAQYRMVIRKQATIGLLVVAIVLLSAIYLLRSYCAHNIPYLNYNQHYNHRCNHTMPASADGSCSCEGNSTQYSCGSSHCIYHTSTGSIHSRKSGKNNNTQSIIIQKIRSVKEGDHHHTNMKKRK